MTGVSWRGARGGAAGRWGGAAERWGGGWPSAWGGGGARSRSRIAGSGGRASLRPVATGRVADGETSAGQ